MTLCTKFLIPSPPFWTEFLRSLARRGLRGVALVISDDHKGLKAAATLASSTPPLS